MITFIGKRSMDSDVKQSCIEFLKTVVENEDQENVDDQEIVSRHIDICLNIIKHSSIYNKRSNIPFRWG